MHALEKILARHAGRKTVQAGEIVNCEVDTIGINDLYPQTMYSFFEMGGTQVKHPDRVLIFLDHYAPPSTVMQAENQRQFRDFAAAQSIPHLCDINEGVCHQVLADKGFSRPGQLMIVTDSHTTIHGAFGAFSTGVGATDCAIALATGKLWFRVPPIFRIRIEGTLQPGVFAKDVILWIIGRLGAEHAIYQGIEFAGSVVESLSISERMALCNMSTEMGAKAAYIKPDAVTWEYLQSQGIEKYAVDETDPDFRFAEDLLFDVSDLPPQVAAPSSVENVFDLRQYQGTRIHQAFLGSCTGGRTQDLAAASKILRGKKISPQVRMLVVPASRRVLAESMEKGYIAALIEAGCTLVSPGCAACLGTHEGMLAEGEVCITSSNRNFPGRMGHPNAKIFLASPAAVAASALAGEIRDPRDDWEGV